MGALPTDFDRYHREWVPARLAEGNGRLAAASAAELGAVAVRVPGHAGFTYGAAGGDLAVTPGVEGAATVVELTAEAWRDFVTEMRTAAGLLYEGGLDVVEGDLLGFVFWEPVFRAVQHGRPIYDAGRVELRGPDGATLDPTRRFRLDDPADEMRHFLREVGALHASAVFGADEVARLAAEVDRLLDEARPGDGRSWWVTRASGAQECCRVIYANDASERLAALFEDPRVARLESLMPEGMRAAVDRLSGITAMVKLPEVVEGLSDLPWHSDCGLGGHSVMCPMLSLGIHLDPATPESGELRVLPGSWGRSTRLMVPSEADRELGLGLRAEAGDVTLHFGDAMHASLAPTRAERGRRTIYLSYYAERAFDVIGPYQALNDVLDARKDGQIRSLVDTLL